MAEYVDVLPNLKVGDVLRLKTGSPKMTAEKVMLGLVDCVWFDDEEKLQRERFKKAMVVVEP